MRTIAQRPCDDSSRPVKRAGTVLAAMAVALTLGCGERAADRAPGTMEDMPMRGMEERMPAMPMPSMAMLPAVRAYLDSLVRAEPGDVPEFTSGHGARIERMLTAMDEDMRALTMPADPAWAALTDSVRTDLAAIPGLSGEPLVLRMRAHAGRMRRLLAQHEAMMKM